MSFILTKPVGGASSGITGTEISDFLIPAGNAINVDSVVISANTAVKWIVTIKDTTTNEVLVQEIMAMYKTSTAAPSYTRYGLIGDKIPHHINVVTTGGGANLELRITNTSANQYSIDIVRIQVVD